MYNDEYYMKKALLLAEKAFKNNEIPVGAVIVKENKIISKAYNKKDSFNVVTKHAELIAIEKANKKLKNWRLNGCTIYVTMEPCPMCASAIQQARMERLVYGCSSNIIKNTEIISEILQNKQFNHYTDICKGICEIECSKIIKKFFKEKRKIFPGK